MNVHIDAIGTEEPAKAPAWKSSWASAAVIRPSLRQPILIRVCAPEVGPVARNTSSRLMVILTGRFDFFESTMAGGFQIDVVLAAGTRRPARSGSRGVLEMSICSSLAHCARITKWPWVAV